MARANRFLLVTFVAGFLACESDGSAPLDPQFAKSGAGGGGGGPSVAFTAVGDIAGGPQTLKGRNTDSEIDADGTITLVLHMDPLDCPEKPGSIPWEPGLVSFLQSESQGGNLSGVLDWHYEKQGGVAIHVNHWTVKLGGRSYKMQWYRETASHTEQPDATVIAYRNMAVEVFKNIGGKVVSREQCTGSTSVDADITVSK